MLLGTDRPASEPSLSPVVLNQNHPLANGLGFFAWFGNGGPGIDLVSGQGPTTVSGIVGASGHKGIFNASGSGSSWQEWSGSWITSQFASKTELSMMVRFTQRDTTDNLQAVFMSLVTATGTAYNLIQGINTAYGGYINGGPFVAYTGLTKMNPGVTYTLFISAGATNSRMMAFAGNGIVSDVSTTALTTTNASLSRVRLAAERGSSAGGAPTAGVYSPIGDLHGAAIWNRRLAIEEMVFLAQNPSALVRQAPPARSPAIIIGGGTTVTPTRSQFGALFSENTTGSYASARAGDLNAVVGVYGGSTVYIGQNGFSNVEGDIYDFSESFVEFDTSGWTGIVSSATLTITTSDLTPTSKPVIEVYARDFGTSITVADFVAGSSIPAVTNRLASLTVPSWSGTTPQTLTMISGPGLTTAINVGGKTRFMLVTDRQRTGTAPTLDVTEQLAATSVSLTLTVLNYTPTAVIASCNGAWGTVSGNANATVKHTASLVGSWGAVTAIASATPKVPASAAGTWGTLSATATISVKHTATVSGSWGAVAASASAQASVLASASGAWAGSSNTASAQVYVTSVGTASCGGWVGNAYAGRQVIASASAAWGGWTGTSTATPNVQAVVTGQFGTMAASAVAKVTVPVQAAGSWFGSWAAYATPDVVAIANGPFGGMAGTASAKRFTNATATGVWGAAVETASAKVSHTATGISATSDSLLAAATVKKTASAVAVWGAGVESAAATVTKLAVASAVYGEWTAAATAHPMPRFRIKVWNGTTWVGVAAQRWDGSAWVTDHKPKAYDPVSDTWFTLNNV